MKCQISRPHEFGGTPENEPPLLRVDYECIKIDCMVNKSQMAKLYRNRLSNLNWDNVSAGWECASVSWGVWVSWECGNVNLVYEWVTGWTLTTRHHHPIVNRSQSNPTLHMTIKDVSLIDLRKLLCVNLKFGEIFTRWFIFWGGSLVGVNFLRVFIYE